MGAVDWVCWECGTKYGSKKPVICTMHDDECDICGEKRGVTEGRDFGLYEWQSVGTSS